MDGVGCGFFILADQHALAQSKAVRLDDHGICPAGPDVIHRRGGIRERLVSGCGDAVFFHQVFRENLAAFDDCGIGARTEGRDSGFLERVYHAGGKRIVRRDEYEIDCLFLCQSHHAGNVRGLDVDALSVAGDTAVAGRAVYFFSTGAFEQLADDRVLAPAAADYQNFDFFFHKRSAFPG